jgi:DNA-binding beta-propeller fold protein YncE
LHYKLVPDFLKLPPGLNLGEVPGVALDSKGHIFVFNRGRQPLIEFDGSGKFVRTLGDGLFTRPHGVRVDSHDNIWTIDVGSHLILKLNPEGRVLLVLGRRDYAGNEEWAFNKPTDVAIGPSEDIFVTDGYGNSRVMKFDKNGRFIKAWGTKGSAQGEFNLPHAIAIDSKGLVYVGDRENKRIQVFDAGGKFVKEWTHVGSPWGLCITPDQYIYMTDGDANRVLKLDLNGNVLGELGGPGKAPGEFAWAHGIAVGPSDEIYISEILSWRVQKFVKR